VRQCAWDGHPVVSRSGGDKPKFWACRHSLTESGKIRTLRIQNSCSEDRQNGTRSALVYWRCSMLLDLIRGLCAAVIAIPLPGYFWAVLLCPAGGLAERLAYSCGLSMATVPVVALILAHLAGSGITLWIAIASVGIVLTSGALAASWKRAAPATAGPILPSPPVIRDSRALVLLILAFLVAFIWGVRTGPISAWPILLILVLLVLAAVLARRPADTAAFPAEPGPATDPGPAHAPGLGPGQATGRVTGQATGLATGRALDLASRQADQPASGGGAQPASGGAAQPAPAGAAQARRQRVRPAAAAVRGAPLIIVLAATAARAYEPVIHYDWPSIRGLDHFSHAVMAEQMLAHGSYPGYLIYPPGFSTLSAVLCRISGLSPLTLFPVLAPALLVITALAAYALATRLWGWGYGIAAAALSGLVLHGAYGGLADGRYPDLVSAYFLIPMGIAALLTLYQSPTVRSALLAAVLGASPVLYHSVATLYEGLILLLAAVTSLPYLLWLRRRAEARMVLLALAGLTLLSTCYAWYTYGVGWPLVRHGATSSAVSLVLGSQLVLPAPHLLAQLAPPIVWLGVLGLAMLAVALPYLRTPPQVLAVVTMILWCVLMYVGGRTAADGFPQRFERDLGAALSVVGALSLGVILKSAWLAWRRARVAPVAVLSLSLAVLAALVIGVQTVRGVSVESRSARLLSAPVVAAGNWLRQHNSGGTIVSTSMNDGITERAVLALGGYTGLMWYDNASLSHPRSLPAGGLKPLLESQEVLNHPDSCLAAKALASEDVRYVVLYRGESQNFDLASFRADRIRYPRVFENRAVIIYAARPGPCGQ
jgi:hypothetical protein